MSTASVIARLCLVGALCAGTRSIAGIADWIRRDYDLQTITVTDMTDAGRQQPIASPQHPMYYAAVSSGYHDYGGIIAGEKPVDRTAANKIMIDVLAKQGYLPAKPGQRPDLIIVWSWGTLNTELAIGFGRGVPSRRYVNERQLVRFLGGAKLGMVDSHMTAFDDQMLSPGLFFAAGDRRMLLDAAHDDLYVAVVAAYAPHLDAHKRATLLWNTRISCPSRGFWLPEALPAMVAIAAPFIGHETERPMWVKATDKFKPDVQIGDMKVVQYLQGAERTVLELGRNN